MKYYHLLTDLMTKFEEANLYHIPRQDNYRADDYPS